ncbi:hypothetical protein PAMA_015915 [Pampus argenteus]
MSEYIYENDPGESKQIEEAAFNAAGKGDEAQERIVSIYYSTGNHGGHNSSLNTRRAVKQSTLYQQPGRASFRAVALCLGLLCILLLAGIIAVGLHYRSTLQTNIMSWTERRQATLFELNHFCRDWCMSFNDSFYYISTTKKNWEDSRKDCKDRGADLIIVNSKEEQEFIASYATHWIGLNDREEKGTWKWVDGSVLNSTGFWKTGAKRRVKNDCVRTYWSQDLNNWMAASCTDMLNWICEKQPM